ncbi:MAG TPA: PilZ domain-containing protein [Acidimicrobiales bacterium]|nr:PilZ domain-containing protein [Acidimicrobiales bacterium]
MALSNDGRSKDRQKARRDFHHWAAHGTQHRRDDRAWPDDGRDLVILRLHKKKDQYSTKLKASDPQRGLLVIRSASAKDGKTIQAKSGDKLMLAWMDESGEHVLPAVIAKVVPEEPPTWVLKQIGIPITKQIRRFARLRDVARIDLSMGNGFIEALRLDLSEGGMKVKIPSNIDYEEGEEIVIKTKVGKRGHQREMTAKALVAKVFNRAGSKEIGLSFIDLPESDKEFIRRHIYERQIHERKLRTGTDD